MFFLLFLLLVFLAFAGARAGAGARGRVFLVLLLVGRSVLFLVLFYGAPVSDLLLFLRFLAFTAARARAGAGGRAFRAFLSLVPFLTGFVILCPGLVVVIDQLVNGLRVGRSLDFLGSGMDRAESKVDTGDYFTFLVVVEFRAEDNFVGGDGRLDGVTLEASRKDHSADGGAG